MSTYICPYKWASRGARDLSIALGATRVPYIPLNARIMTSRDTLINWGNTVLPEAFMGIGVGIINHPNGVGKVTDKIKFFNGADNFRVPEWTTDRATAQRWIDENEEIVVCRLLTRASGGRGIEVVDEGPLPPAPLYTKFVPNDREFRIHFMASEIILKQEKKKKRDWSGVRDPYIRNHSNGYVLAFRDIDVPEDVMDQANRAIMDFDLDFGAIDIIYDRDAEKAYVLEINTAPGITGNTLEIYKNAFRTYYGC